MKKTQGRIQDAIAALAVAKTSGGELDLPHYASSYDNLVAIRDAIRKRDEELNDSGTSPSGEDYNFVLGVLGLDVTVDHLEERDVIAQQDPRGRVQFEPVANQSSEPTTDAWVMGIPVLSTAHITEATNDRLSSDGGKNPWGHCAKYEFGYFLAVPASDTFTDAAQPPTDLQAIWTWARHRNIQWVRLDQAGDVIDGLPTYDW